MGDSQAVRPSCVKRFPPNGGKHVSSFSSPLLRVRRNWPRASLPSWREWVRVPSLAFEYAAAAHWRGQPSRKRQDVGSTPAGGF